MAFTSSASTNVFLTKWLGKTAKPCRHCNCGFFHVNKMGGLVCSNCNPPRDESDNQLQLMTITIGGEVIGGDHSEADKHHWECWDTRAALVLEEHKKALTANSAFEVDPERVVGGKVIWAEMKQEIEFQRLAAEKGESLEVFRERKMNSF